MARSVSVVAGPVGATFGPAGVTALSVAPALSELMMSVTIIYGLVVSPPVHRITDTGTSFELDVRSRAMSGQTVSVSVVMTGELPEVAEGDVVLVVGSARRRFFRTGGATVSRTEVQATTISVNPDKRKRRRVTEDAALALAALISG
jgi:hypothetical protein